MRGKKNRKYLWGRESHGDQQGIYAARSFISAGPLHIYVCIYKWKNWENDWV